MVGAIGGTTEATAVSAADLAVTPPPAVPVDPGERFEQTLAQHGSPALRRLPQRFDPIAKAIVKRPDRVRISTGEASRKALASVGKVAATAGDVVHLATPLTDTPDFIDILAHELTHVANPSPLVRFFDDDRDSSEERLAREMGSIMAKAPVGSPPAAPPPPAPSTSGGPNGGAGRASGGAGQDDGGASGPAGRLTGPPTPPAPPSPAPVSSNGSAGAPPSPAGGGVEATDDVAVSAGVDVDRLLDALEARIIRELERRGRRWPRPI